MMKQFEKLLHNQDGTSVVELGLLTPVLASLLMGMIDISNAYSEKLRIEQAAQSAIEKVMQRSGDAGTTIGTLKAEAASQAGVKESAVTVDFWLECNGTRQTDYNTTCTTGAAYARYLQVKIVGEYDPMFPLRVYKANENGNYSVTGHAGIRTQ